MQISDYESQAMRTARVEDDKEAQVLAVLALCGEAGELANLVKKKFAYKKPITRDQIGDELGDVLWYVARVAQAYGLSLESVAHMNLVKLKKRFPDGYDQSKAVQDHQSEGA